MFKIFRQNWNWFGRYLGWVTIGLLLISALFTTISQDWRAIFGWKTEIRMIADGITVHLSFVDPLPVFAKSGTRAPLLLWISTDGPSSPVADCDVESYSLYVSVQEPGLVILDLAEEPVIDEPIATAVSLAELNASFYLAHVGDSSAFLSTSSLLVTIVPTQATATRLRSGPLKTSFEVSTQRSFLSARWGFLARQVVELADTLALLLALFVVVWEWRNWRKEEDDRFLKGRVSELKRRLDKSESRLQRDWLEGIVELAAVLGLPGKEDWDESLHGRIQEIRGQYCSKEQQGRFLREVGIKYRQEANVQSLRHRLNGAKCFVGDLQDELQPCLDILENKVDQKNAIQSLGGVFADLWDLRGLTNQESSAGLIIGETQANDPPTKADFIVNPLRSQRSVFALWETYAYDAQAIVAAVSRYAIDARLVNEADVKDELKKPGRIPLRLQLEFRTLSFEQADLYEWPDFVIPPGDGSQCSPMDFLQAYGFRRDPFASICDSAVQDRRALADLEWLQPPGALLEQLTERPSFNMSDWFDDGLACATASYRNLGSNKTVVPMLAIMQGRPNGARVENSSWGDSLGRIVAEWWLELLSRNPVGFLAQPYINQGVLFDLLLWYCGSVEVLDRKLNAHNHNQLLSASLQALKTQRPHIFQPTLAQFVEWLSLRPPGRDADADKTVMLIVLPPRQCRPHLASLEWIAQQLLDHNVYLHFFGQPRATDACSVIRVSPVKWEDREIQDMMDRRIQSYANMSSLARSQGLAALVEPPPGGPKDPYSYVKRSAHGSLHQALRFCRITIDEVRSLQPLTPEDAIQLTEEALRAALVRMEPDVF